MIAVTDLQWNQSHRFVHVGAVFLFALALKIYFFHKVGVFGDFGYWAYDSRMIMNGLTPFVDFPGRSPLMVYLLAVVRTALGDVLGPLVTLRATVVVLWLLASLPVYAIGQTIHGHRAGLVAMLAFTSAPFGLVYGMWLNSQSLGALLSLTAVVLILRRADDVWPFAAAGGLVGLAFLSRRATIVVLGGIGFWTMWYLADESDWDSVAYWRALLGRGVATASAFLVALLVGYVGVAGGDLGLAWSIFELDFLGLFQTGGRGAYPVVGVDVQPPTPDIEGGGIPILNDFCPGCGAWTARRGLKILILSTPVAGFFAAWVRDWVDELYSRRVQMYLVGIFGPLLGYAIYLAAVKSFPYRIAAIVAFIIFGVAVWRAPKIEKEILYHPGMRFLLITMSLMIVSYLARNRRIIVYYMMDNWGYMCAAAGVLAVALWDRAENPARVLLLGAVVLGLISSSMIAAPLGNLTHSGFLTLSAVGSITEDLSERTDTDDRVLSPHPTYVAGSDARVYRDNIRIYMTAMLFDGGNFSQRQRAALSDALSTGRITWVIRTRFAADLLSKDGVAKPFNESYCPVRAPVYERENATLYRYVGDRECNS